MCKFSYSVITLLFALTSFSAQAQMADRLSEYPAMRQRTASLPEATALTREMMARLHLNEGQYLKLLPLNQTKLARLSGINREYRHDEALRNAKAAELEAQYEQECSRILTPSQLSQLQQNNSHPATEPASTGNGLG